MKISTSRVGRGRILQTPFNCPTPKTATRYNDLEDISYPS